ncbi:oxidoreductase, short-chain dehydrogenase/reductase family [Aspergillus nomiae NRRL 13137]|uniref:Oxidoreductase, short-chain dehydrogenase/reductase family n=1 Tax=Aspergillus nomiae NRRL (strain ATCC 15546 / NRRL 13137 / CBS 260.88 / M93) TaxID=1509407 RepID=A0A0L1JAB6_ASPN3|nr:oxidoreductase, short-chain dehydrogenase/reductase family [Aspergillus nomiae NRRL 13137]KNG88689.1 oxidoreductase, short-chain dehydrogenase/reductase family [Aspergillus nomiae NRRL 13137]
MAITLDSGIALVTGAASGIGKETAFALAQAGVEGVILADLNHSGAESVAQDSQKWATHSNFRATAVQVDVSDEAAVNNMVEAAVKEFGRIDYCVHSVGMESISGAATQHLKIDVYDQTMAVNARGTMLVLRAVSAAMAKQEPRMHQSARHGTSRSLGRGSIVVVNSVNGNMVAPGMLSYTASKHAVVGIAKTAGKPSTKEPSPHLAKIVRTNVLVLPLLAIDNLKNHIRVNIVAPFHTETAMFEANLKRYPELGVAIKAMTPLKRAASAEEVADPIVFLCSPAASYTNGATLIIDSGVTLTIPRTSL